MAVPRILLLLAVTAALVASGIVPHPRSDIGAQELALGTPVGSLPFGADPAGVQILAEHGIHAHFVQMWAGAWLERHGWDWIDQELARAVAEDRVPVVQFYYWGDDLTASCFAFGCATHDGLVKDQAGWQRVAEDLAVHLNRHARGHRVVIVLESEFNKELRGSEELDEALAVKANLFRSLVPSARVALGFGNWDRDAWATFDRAAAAADEVSLQALRGSTRHDLASYAGVADDLVAGAQRLKELFGKPILVSDVGLSTYGGPEFIAAQASALARIFERTEDLRAAGVYGLVYRSVLDGGAPVEGHFGLAEHHFGLYWSHNATAKPAMHVVARAQTGAGIHA